MRWFLLALLGVMSAAHAEPQAFDIRINTTTLNEVRQQHTVTPITQRLFSQGMICDDEYGCPPLTPIEGVNAYHVDITDGGVMSFEIQTDDKGVVKFMLIQMQDLGKGYNSHQVKMSDYLDHKYGAFEDEYGLWQWGYLRSVRDTTNAWVMDWSHRQDDYFFVMLSDKDYLKMTRYDLTPFYTPPKPDAVSHF
ncbi:hypothetical protein AB4427_04280 [Vibrio artabrorum]|uniref:hypothetical protein n=1 Tax=Vibrio artabrorum TaxID=446374 RepID=UPI00354D0E75